MRMAPSRYSRVPVPVTDSGIGFEGASMNLRHHIALATTLVAACFTPVTAGAQTTANGPYYATPSWDQTLPAATRFVVLANFANEAALDRETGLVWQRSAFDVTALLYAERECHNARTGGKFGWRLPTITELGSLFDPSNTAAPYLPTGHPFLSLPIGVYLSATPALLTGPYSATVLGAAFGSLYVGEQKPSDGGHVLCVRAPS
jgi:hypothetical protein